MDEIFMTDSEIFMVIDIGCGDGRYIPMLLEKFPRCSLLLGVDISRRPVTKAKQRLSNGVAYVVADANALPFRDSIFCLAFSKDVVHHIRNPIKTLREIGRICKGRIVIVEANRLNVAMLLCSGSRFRHFTLNQFKTFFNKANIKIHSLRQLHVYPVAPLRGRLKPVAFSRNEFINLVYVLTMLCLCRIAPTLAAKTFLKISSFLFEPSYNIISANQ